jgi:hypothetical protein
MTTRLHSEAINLGLHVDGFFCVCLQPGNIDLNIEVADTDIYGQKGHTLNWKL